MFRELKSQNFPARAFGARVYCYPPYDAGFENNAFEVPFSQRRLNRQVICLNVRATRFRFSSKSGMHLQ